MLSIIVVSYNTREMTVECLRSIFREAIHDSYEVIVLDNASTDGSVEEIELVFKDRITLISSTINLGFAAGNNYAVREAKGNRILLLNPDTVVLNHAIDRLLEFSREYPDAGIWGGRSYSGDGKIDVTSCWSRQTLWSLFCRAFGLTKLFKHSGLMNPEGIGDWNREGVRRVDIVTGCFMLIDRGLWDGLKGFNEQFYMYGEEADFCLRALSAGCNPIVTDEAAIIHYGGASEVIRADKLVRLLKAKMLLIRYHISGRGKYLGFFLLYLWPLNQYLFRLLGSLVGIGGVMERKAWREVVQRRDEWFAYTPPNFGVS
jgi:N-acetylglucosaminyl-diphospho-decaprenol L-rhamnosyltransferase